jgi:hypothetical protein
MTESKLVAEGKKTAWTVVYEVKEVLKGEYSAATLTVKLDSESFKKRAKSGSAGRNRDDLLILFLVKGKEQSFQYKGPALNSPEIAATPENVAAVRAEIDRQAASGGAWYDAAVIGVLLIAGFVIAVIVLAFLVRKRHQLAPGSPDNDGS